MLKRFLIYVLPIYLMTIEWAMDKTQVIEHSNALGPTLAAVALGLLGSVVVPKLRIVEMKKEIKGRKTVEKLFVNKPSDQKLCEIGWIVLFASLMLWAYILYLTERDVILNLYITSLPTSVTIGIAIYIVSILLSELKEVF
jgi:hypothetical protein